MSDPPPLAFLFVWPFLLSRQVQLVQSGYFFNFLALSSVTVAADLAATDFLLARWFSRSGCRTIRWSFRWYGQ